MPATEIIVPLGFFAAVFGIVYIAVTARHRQRMAMIEKGMDPGNLSRRETPFADLRRGLLFIGVGLGLYLGWLVARHTQMGMAGGDPDDGNPLPYFMMVALCAGVAMVLHHLIVRKQLKD